MIQGKNGVDAGLVMEIVHAPHCHRDKSASYSVYAVVTLCVGKMMLILSSSGSGGGGTGHG